MAKKRALESPSDTIHRQEQNRDILANREHWKAQVTLFIGKSKTEKFWQIREHWKTQVTLFVDKSKIECAWQK